MQKNGTAIPPPTTFPVTGLAPRTWWQRNWLRVVVGGAIAATIIFFAGIAAIVIGSFAVMRSSGACEEAVARAAAAPAVVQALGTPLKTGWFVTGSLNPGRHAEMTIRIKGPKGKARIEVVASRNTGQWRFSTLEVTIDASGERVSLLNSPPTHTPGEAGGER